MTAELYYKKEVSEETIRVMHTVHISDGFCVLNMATFLSGHMQKNVILIVFMVLGLYN